MLTAPGPDLAGFVDAQQRLRAGFGEDVTFLQPLEVTFAPDVPLDPETGAPFDPTVKPTASAQASAVVRCNVQFRAISRGGTGGSDDVETAVGIHAEEHMTLIADIADRAKCEPAVDAVVRGIPVKIMSQKPDGVGGVQRWLVYVRAK